MDLVSDMGRDRLIDVSCFSSGVCYNNRLPGSTWTTGDLCRKRLFITEEATNILWINSQCGLLVFSQTKTPVRINKLVRLEILKKKIPFSSLTLLVSFFCAISPSSFLLSFLLTFLLFYYELSGCPHQTNFNLM